MCYLNSNLFKDLIYLIWFWRTFNLYETSYSNNTHYIKGPALSPYDPNVFTFKIRINNIFDFFSNKLTLSSTEQENCLRVENAVVVVVVVVGGVDVVVVVVGGVDVDVVVVGAVENIVDNAVVVGTELTCLTPEFP